MPALDQCAGLVAHLGVRVPFVDPAVEVLDTSGAIALAHPEVDLERGLRTFLITADREPLLGAQPTVFTEWFEPEHEPALGTVENIDRGHTSSLSSAFEGGRNPQGRIR